jgi:hypothetical protein
MPRIPPIITINVLLHHSGAKYKIEIVPTPWSGKYRARLNRRNSRKFQEGNISGIFNLLRKMIVALLRRSHLTMEK